MPQEIGALIAFFAPVPPFVRGQTKAPEKPPGVIVAAYGAFEEFAVSSRYVEDHFVNETCDVLPYSVPPDPGLYVFEGEVEPMDSEGREVNLVGRWRNLTHWELILFASSGVLPWEDRR